MASYRKRGSSWEVRIRRAGQPTLSKTFPTKYEAQAWASTIEGSMLRGVFEDRREAEATTLREALDRYLREITPSKRGAAQEKAVISVLQKAWIADLTLAGCRGVDVARWRDERLQIFKPATVKRELAVLSHLYTIAIKEWSIEGISNPVLKIRRPKVADARERRLHFGEEEKLLEVLTGEMEALVILALETAMRRGELLNLRWEMISGNVARLPPGADNKRGRAVPLTQKARQALKQLPRNISGAVFTLRPDYVSHAFADACERCGIDGLRFHDLRHEAVSRLFEKGLDMMEVMKISGHKSSSMLNRYTHLQMSDLLDKMD